MEEQIEKYPSLSFSRNQPPIRQIRAVRVQNTVEPDQLHFH